MKKILIALPVILCLILSVCVPLTSVAEEEDYGYRSLEYFQTKIDDYEADYNGTDYYLYLQARQSPDTKNTYSQYCVWSPDKADIIDGDGVLTINFKSSHSYYVTMGLSYGFSSLGQVSIDRIVIDSNNNVISFYDGNTQCFPFDAIYLVDYETNIAQASQLPDVSIRFQPNLKDDVSRDIIENGQKIGLLDSLKFSITNNSNFPVQYLIRIRPVLNYTDEYFDFLGRFDTFIYTKKDYIYDVIGHNSAEEDWISEGVSLYLKPTYYHYLPAKTNEQVSIPFSMINLKEDTTYYVEVQAWRNDYLHASTRIVDYPNPLYYEIDSNITSICYSENFKMLQYSDIKYDHSLSSGGVLPYQNSNDFQHYNYMYDAKTDMKTGELIVGHKDLYNDPNSWLNKKPASPSFNVDGDEISSDVFTNSFSQVFGFVSMFLSWLPPSILTIFIFGFSSIVIIAIIKAVK